MKTIRISVGGFWVITVLLLANGCVYTFPDYPVQAAANYRNHLEQDGVIVGVHPLTSASEQKKYFDTNLNSRNILPVFVVIENHNPQTSILVSKEDIGLYDGSNYATEDMLASGKVGKAIAVTGLLLISSPIMVIGGAIVTDADNIKHNFKIKELTRQMLSTHQTTSGFMYFPLSAKDKKTKPDLLISVKLEMLPSNQQKIFTLRMK